MKMQLLIMMDEAGNIGIEGPIEQKMLCYGLLDCARDAIKDYNDKAAAQNGRIAIARPGAVPDPARDRHVSFDAPLQKLQ